ncbi:tyrosinase-like [Glandiceps talaboti]
MSQAEVEKFKAYLLKTKETLSDYRISKSIYADMNNGRTPLFNSINAYDLHTWLHYYASRNNMLTTSEESDGVIVTDFGHGGPAFFTFHRLLLMSFERMVQQINEDDDFAIPYWDWSEASNCDICTDQYLGGNTASPPFFVTGDFGGWESLCDKSIVADDEFCKYDDAVQKPSITRNPGGRVFPFLENTYKLPSRHAVLYSLSIGTFDRIPEGRVGLSRRWKMSPCSFRNTLEGFAESEGQTGIVGQTHKQLHNLVHYYMNGTITYTNSAPNDPLFYVHHANVDRIGEKWIRRYKASPEDFPTEGAPVGHAGESHVCCIFPVWKNKDLLVKSDTLGYTYDDIDDNGRPLDAHQREKEEFAISIMPGCRISSEDNELIKNAGNKNTLEEESRRLRDDNLQKILEKLKDRRDSEKLLNFLKEYLNES